MATQNITILHTQAQTQKKQTKTIEYTTQNGVRFEPAYNEYVVIADGGKPVDRRTPCNS